jgi:heme exporter protein C
MQNQSLTQKLANPTRFMDFSGRILPWLAVAGVAVIAYAIYLAFFVAPEDYQQGQTFPPLGSPCLGTV